MTRLAAQGNAASFWKIASFEPAPTVWATTMLSFPIELLILALLVLANGLLAMAETAVVSARKTRLRRLAGEGREGAARALALTEQPARFLALVQFWLTLSGMIAGVLGGARLAGQFERHFQRVPELAPFAGILAFILVTVGLSAFMLLFGELVPKRVGLAYPERVASFLAGLMGALAWLASPFLRVLELATGAITKLARIPAPSAADGAGEDEVRALVERGLHAGVFQPAEKEMVDGVLALDQRRVTALMTPRPKIVFLNIDDPEETNWRKIVTSGHSYFPVFQGNRDQIVGLVAVKALWAHSAIGLPTTLRNLLVTPLLVPEATTAMQMLEQFKKSGRHLAIVTDEFGAVQGLVTLKDVFESIVGELPEPGGPKPPEAKLQENGAWLIDATLSVSEFKALLGVDGLLPSEKEAEFQTVGGFAVTQFGRIPVTGDRFEWRDWRFEVVDMDRRRLDKLLVTRVAPVAPAK